VDPINVVLQSFIKTFKFPAWAIKTNMERVLPVLFSPGKVSGDLSSRTDVDVNYGLETGTVAMTLLYFVMYLTTFILMLSLTSNLSFAAAPEMKYIMPLMMLLMIVIELPIAVAMTLLFSFIGVGAIWWVGKKLGGKTEFGRFYGTLMPLVSLMIIIYSLSALIFMAAMMNQMFSDNVDSVSNTFKIFVPILFGMHLLWLIYLTIFTEKAHGIPKIKALISCIIPLSPFILIGIMQALMFTRGF